MNTGLILRTILRGDFMEAWIFWAVIAVAAFIFEAVTVGLVSVWFGLGALAASLFSAVFAKTFGSQVLFVFCQVIVFVGFSALFLYLTKPLVSRFFKPEETNAPAIIGKEALVLSDINNLEGTGSVKIGSAVWSAKSENDEIIRKGERVTVKGIAGVSAVVSAAVAEKVV